MAGTGRDKERMRGDRSCDGAKRPPVTKYDDGIQECSQPQKGKPIGFIEPTHKKEHPDEAELGEHVR